MATGARLDEFGANCWGGTFCGAAEITCARVASSAPSTRGRLKRNGSFARRALEATRTQGARKTMTRTRLLKTRQIVKLRHSLPAPRKDLRMVLKDLVRSRSRVKKSFFPAFFLSLLF